MDLRKTFALLAGLGLTSPAAAYALQQRVEVVIDTTEAAAALAILESSGSITDTHWTRLFQTEGYRRLAQRERGLRRPFADSAFKAFLLSPTARAGAGAWRKTLASWSAVDAGSAAERAFVYLPAHARIRATIYPVIKPAKNTFVFEPRTNPAIFFYLEPAMSRDQFENTLVHELHHLGVAAACPRDESASIAIQWMGAFAEGRAMLAAAGSPEVHPHVTSPPEERAVWDRDYVKVSEDIRRLESFFTDLMDNKLTESDQSRVGMQFFSTEVVPQGAFYTVGYLMAAAVETHLGRDRLIATTCDPKAFVLDYMSVARKRGLPPWSDVFLQRL